ncbi:uncharacterized protein EAF02_010926 [Botrytis sinoallii]|uniref:uncharacterized protein n=1 Tax=Botrytis sinoallii TaxID=1463999 RepID=UPI00190109EA|nr:uncharacterized protein EAF02_010926 [Botrytis sinoallii]KAF7859478.1 hypothetical protein EAF02_010926 [Botrytis sinoallii]
MSLGRYHLGSSGRHGQLDEYGQSQQQNYGGDQSRESNFRSGDIQGTYNHGPDRNAMNLPPLNPTDSIAPSPHPTNNYRLPPISSVLRPPAPYTYHSAQASSTTILRTPENFHVPAARLYSNTTSQSQHYLASELRSREAPYHPSDTGRSQESGSQKYPLNTHQLHALKHEGNKGTDSMQQFQAVIPTSMQRSLPPLGRPGRDIATPSSRRARKDKSRRRQEPRERSKSYSSDELAFMPPQQPSQGYCESLRYHATVKSPQVVEDNSRATEEMPADSDMECLLPTCKTRISKNASFGACGSHRDQLSTWDFSYCEAEMGRASKGEVFFPNGQCRNKKPSGKNRWCAYHGFKAYRWRDEFMASDCMKDGKWF